MFEMDNTKNNFAITDYDGKYPKYIYKQKRKECKRVKRKLHQKHQFL